MRCKPVWLKVCNMDVTIVFYSLLYMLYISYFVLTYYKFTFCRLQTKILFTFLIINLYSCSHIKLLILVLNITYFKDVGCTFLHTYLFERF